MVLKNTEQTKLNSEMARLRRANQDFKKSKNETKQKFLSTIRTLLSLITCLLLRINELEKEVIELQRQRDNYRDMVFKPNKHPREALPQTDSDESAVPATCGILDMNHPPRKKRGAQKGHKGCSRPREKKIDEIRHTHLEKCPICETQLKRSQTTQSHTVEDIPGIEEIKVRTIRYDSEIQWCPRCKKRVKARPVGVIPRCRLGINVFLYVLVHKYMCRETWETIVFNLFNWYGLKVSKGSLVGMMHRARNFMGHRYDDLLEKVRRSKVKYADETSWRVLGMNHWLWGFFTDCYAYYTIEESRGKGVPQNIFKGSDPNDVLIRDDYGGYKKLQLQHQSCWAHLLRQSRERAERPEASDEMKKLHAELKTMFNALQEIVCQPFRPKKRLLAYKLYKINLQHIIDRQYTYDDVIPIKNRIANQNTNLITALRYDNVPLTNNHSERNIRPLVVTRKISGGSRSKNGAKTHAVHMSIMQSIRLQKGSLLPTLKKYIFENFFPNSE
jgi:transposase